jgi:hypothetical protein
VPDLSYTLTVLLRVLATLALSSYGVMWCGSFHLHQTMQIGLIHSTVSNSFYVSNFARKNEKNSLPRLLEAVSKSPVLVTCDTPAQRS